MAKATKGRPTEYTEAWATKICELVADGSNLNKMCKKKGFPKRPTVYEWMSRHKSFSDSYAQARTDRADTRADKIDDICEKVEGGDLDPQSARVIIDALKWQAGKEDQSRYGDKLDLNHKGGITVTTGEHDEDL